MWPRMFEVSLGCWLLLSPFIFEHRPEWESWWATDWICGALAIALALGSLWRPLVQLHLLNIAVGLWLVGFGFVMAPSPPPPGLQNQVMVGLLLGLFAVLPTEATEPPEGWRRFQREVRIRQPAGYRRDRAAG